VLRCTCATGRSIAALLIAALPALSVNIGVPNRLGREIDAGKPFTGPQLPSAVRVGNLLKVSSNSRSAC
jgi:hypothetical protein